MKKTLLYLGIVSTAAAAFIYGVTAFRQTFATPNWKILRAPDDQEICFVLYTVDDRVLNLTAQLYQLDPGDDRTVYLDIKMDGRWVEIAAEQVQEPEFLAEFQIQDWDDSRAFEYQVRQGKTARYTGRIRQNPRDQDEIVLAAFTGNSNTNRGPRPDLIENIQRLDPDLLFFSGDQVYDHQDHLASWLLFGRQFGEITRNRPTVVIPDDHDVGNANLWGAGGEPGFGGYRDPAYVRQVENAQTSHLPDPYDPTPIQRGIGTYYTSLNWGGIGFAILEDRKFKSQIDILDREALEEAGVVFSRPDHIKKLPDPALLDVPGGKLLGERQLVFLEEWTADWQDQEMKAVLSQAPFTAVAHLHGPSLVPLAADLDANGWPQSARDRALRMIRKGFAVIINGDQHLATVVQMGVETWGDAGYSFSVPSIVNHYRRWWSPDQKPSPLPAGELAYTGDYLDPLGNRLTMHAYANPNPTRVDYNRWTAQGAGFGMVRFHKRERTITLECWPRGCDITDPSCQQYPGWPITIRQEDNYGRPAEAWLPNLIIRDAADPVVQVRKEPSGEMLYTLRIQGNRYQPPVFQEGNYTIIIRSGDQQVTLPGVAAGPREDREPLIISLEDQESLP